MERILVPVTALVTYSDITKFKVFLRISNYSYNLGHRKVLTNTHGLIFETTFDLPTRSPTVQVDKLSLLPEF